MSLVFCGTESPNVLSLKLLPDGKVEITQRLPVSSNPLALKYGSPGGIAVEWVTVHPRGRALRADRDDGHWPVDSSLGPLIQEREP